MNRLKTSAVVALMMWAGTTAWAQPRDHVQAIRLAAPSLSEMVTPLLKDDGSIEIEPGATIPRRCAERDLAATIMIEQFGEAGSVEGAVLVKAFLVTLEARGACLAGRPINALALYDGVFALLNEFRRLRVGGKANP